MKVCGGFFSQRVFKKNAFEVVQEQEVTLELISAAAAFLCRLSERSQA